jgi:hypothetical protein
VLPQLAILPSIGRPDTLIAGAAAIGGGVIGARAILRQTTATLSSDKQLQAAKLQAEENLSRDARAHEQRRDAYVPMVTYVTWAMRVNQIRTNVNDRGASAAVELRPSNIQDMTAEVVAAMRVAFDNNRPYGLGAGNDRRWSTSSGDVQNPWIGQCLRKRRCSQ